MTEHGRSTARNVIVLYNIVSASGQIPNLIIFSFLSSVVV